MFLRLLLVRSGAFFCLVHAAFASAGIPFSVQWDGREWPLATFRADRIGIVADNGEVRFPEAARLVASQMDASWLDHGYAPLQYSVERQQPDYHRQRRGGPLHQYLVRVLATVREDRISNDVDLRAVWGALPDADNAIWIIGWWQASKQAWARTFQWRRSTSGLHFSLTLNEAEIEGCPVLFLYVDGKLIPPSAYWDNPEHAALLPLLMNPAPDAALSDDPASAAQWIQAAAAWGRTEWLARLPAGTVGKRSPLAALNPYPLLLAASHGHTDSVRALLRAGFSATIRDPMGFDAGHFAAKDGHAGVFQALLEAGYRPGRKAADDVFSPINLALTSGHDDLFGLLVEKGQSVNRLNRSKRHELLAFHAHRGAAELVSYLLGQRADPNRLIDGRTALAHAVQSGNPEVVRQLLAKGARLDVSGSVPPLIVATMLDDLPNARVLLEAGADPRMPAADGHLPLTYAILHGNRELVALLLAHGADPSHVRAVDQTSGAVELATVAGYREIVRDLFEAGATCQIPPDYADLMLEAALRNDIPEMAMLAQESCLDPEFRLHGAYPLGWVAQYYEAANVMQWLAEVGRAEPTPPENLVSGRAVDQMPRLARATPFVYSEAMYLRYGALNARLRILIDEEGVPRLARSVGDPLPREVALELLSATHAWRFTPAVVGDQPVKVIVTLPVPLDFQPEDAHAFEPSQVQTPPRPLRQPPPQYPPDLQFNRISGEVRVSFVVTVEGTVAQPEILYSTHPFLSYAVYNMLEDWRFEPALKDGRPVPSRVSIAFPFRVP